MARLPLHGIGRVATDWAAQHPDRKTLSITPLVAPQVSDDEL